MKVNLKDLSSVNTSFETFQSQLLDALPPLMNEVIYNMYLEAWEYVEESGEAEDEDDAVQRTLYVFQQILAQVKDWDEAKIEKETKFLTKKLKWLREVLRQMLISRVVILLSVQGDEFKKPNFEFEMPSNESIVHSLYLKVTKRIRARVSLYNHLVSEEEREMNTIEAEEIIQNAIKRAIPSLVPIDKVMEAAAAQAQAQAQEEEECSAVVDEVSVDEECSNEEVSVEQEQEEQEEEVSNNEVSNNEVSNNEVSNNEGDSIEGDSNNEEGSIEEAAVVDEKVSDEKVSDEKEEGDDEMASSSSEKEEKEEKPDIVLDREQIPNDPSVVEETVFEDDSPKEIKLKGKAKKLKQLLESLEEQLRQTPKRQKTIRASLKEEIDFRLEQLEKVRKRLNDE